MSKSDDAEDLDPNELRRVINLLHQELPEILGSNYRSFKEKLDSLLTNADNKELLALFAIYPIAYDRLQDRLNFFSAGGGLYGDSISTRPTITYICPVGSHPVSESEVQKRDVMGRPLCPRHGRAMNLA